MDTSTPEGQERRKAQLARKEIDRLTKRHRKTGETWIVNYLHSMYGIGDPDISPDGDFNRA